MYGFYRWCQWYVQPLSPDSAVETSCTTQTVLTLAWKRSSAIACILATIQEHRLFHPELPFVLLLFEDGGYLKKYVCTGGTESSVT